MHKQLQIKLPNYELKNIYPVFTFHLLVADIALYLGAFLVCTALLIDLSSIRPDSKKILTPSEECRLVTWLCIFERNCLGHALCMSSRITYKPLSTAVRVCAISMCEGLYIELDPLRVSYPYIYSEDANW